MRLLYFAAAAALIAPAAAYAQSALDGAVGPSDHALGHGPHPTSTDDAAMPPMSGHGMGGALGAYPMARDASGTAWQPDASEHSGIHLMLGDWMLMGHAVINGVYDRQDGPRGDEGAFASGMIMGMARRSFTSGDALQLRAMLSPDPLMGKRGYPLLLQTGETADGVTPLVDRQHPHDLFMELSATYSHRLTEADSLFVYAGLPGEPAFGPPAFMHRLSSMDSPEAPISHHWLDSTHVTYGVLTAGYVHADWKIEVSRFKGREPDQDRYDIESPKLDSTAVRLSWNPTGNLALQASWADVKSPEQLEPEQNQRKWSVSGVYTRRIGDHGWWSSTAAWGRRSAEHGDLDAWLLESALKPDDAWTIFGRVERLENNELAAAAGHHGATYTVGKISIGAIHDWTLAQHVKLGLGALYAKNYTPRGLEPLYGGDPAGVMGFVRLKID